MRLTHFWILAAFVAVWTATPLSSVVAASTASPADRTRIALLVYQSQSARQADLRRGDALTRELRIKADAAQKVASTTRMQLASARAEGVKAQRVATDLARKLERQEQTLAETAEMYATELAQRDEEYARERSILTSTGERLLRTSEGRQVLDLFNAGGEANWKEARKILEESRRVRRSLDARDAATLYLRARDRGQEQTANVIKVYEEVVRDDPQAGDWTELALLYRDFGNIAKAREAAKHAEGLAHSDAERGNVWLAMAAAERSYSDFKGSLQFYDRGLAALERHISAHPADTAIRFILAKNEIYSAEVLHFISLSANDRSLIEMAKTRLHDGIDQTTTLMATDPKIDGRVLLIHAKVMLGEILRMTDNKDLLAKPYYEEAIVIGRNWMKDEPESIFARENLVFALHAKAVTLLRSTPSEIPSMPNEAAPLFEESLHILQSLKRDDPSSTFYDGEIQFASESLAQTRADLKRTKPAR